MDMCTIFEIDIINGKTKCNGRNFEKIKPLFLRIVY